MRLLLLAASLLLVAPAARAANPVVRFTTPLGAFDVELCQEPSALCEAGVPVSVANFLGYVDRGDYAGSVIHRSTRINTAGVVVVQGGGFRREAPDAIRAVPTQPAIPNDFHQSNERGTVAWARLGAQPDSATSQWFVNVADNLVLDTLDGGFTVFGVVMGDGMAVVDAISALGRVNFFSIPCLDVLYGPTDPLQIAGAFQEPPVNAEFFALVAPLLLTAESCDDLPPPVDFANALIGTEITRVPEPGGAAAGLAAAFVLAFQARRRARSR